ncbi:chemotaxis protein CheC [Archangium gephyra]|uniref:Chemotaxis protein CheC n=1 Tax=Archangium gephyra TaxID=48 RepID=A0AAC8QHU1_9BACT|nr:chemotaxis protein CheC [Archangium gephyra]AKJ07796.1 Chemotaxis protein CheC -- inhibitor of MCP methylation [Archangium gephyra]REG29548.1 chemotaxis protein CheC [Archangium gephyra]
MSPSPSDIQLDALREVANIGCGHAVNALARLVGGRTVNLSVPRAVLAAPADVAELLGGAEAPVVAAKLGMEGQLRGVLLLVLPREDSSALEALLLRRQDAPAEERESALSEAANIVASACLSAIGTLTGWRLLPTVPELVRGAAGLVVSRAVTEAQGGDRVVVLETRFSAVGAPAVSGQVLLVLERESSKALLARLGV